MNNTKETNRTFIGEVWKEIAFDFIYTNELRLEVSNFGRIRTFTKTTEGNIIKGSVINGYPIVRLKFFKKRSEEVEKRFEYFKEQISKLVQKTGKLKTALKVKKVKDKGYFESKKQIEENEKLLDSIKKSYSKEFRTDELKRTINYAALIHRLVAENFLEQPSPEHTLVAHLDYNKKNNHVNNLIWMTRKENTEHQKKSPYVIAEKKSRVNKRNENTKVYKLTSTKVMLIKKRINEGVPLRTLAKTFKVTETQLLRIKRGINWGNVDPAG
jgi:hypothetical protein